MEAMEHGRAVRERQSDKTLSGISLQTVKSEFGPRCRDSQPIVDVIEAESRASQRAIRCRPSDHRRDVEEEGVDGLEEEDSPPDGPGVAGGAGAGATPNSVPDTTGGNEQGGTRCPCHDCNYECCLLAQQHRRPIDVDAMAMELRMFVASQERMARDVQRYREQRAGVAPSHRGGGGGGGGGGPPSDSSTDQYHTVATCLDDLARRAPTESCEHLAGTLGELALLRAALGPVVDSVLVSDLHRLRDLRRRTGTPSAPASLSSDGSIVPMSAQEPHHTDGHPSRGRFVTFPSEARPDARLADEWRAVLGHGVGQGGQGRAATKQRVLKSECLRVRPAFSSECLRSAVALPARPAPTRSRSDSDIVSLHSVASSRAHSQDVERASAGTACKSGSSVQRSRSRSRVTLASLASVGAVGATSGPCSGGSRRSADSGLAESDVSAPSYPSVPSGGAESLDQSGDVLRDADKSLSEDVLRNAEKTLSMEAADLRRSLREDFKEDLGTCAFFGSRRPSGDRARGSRGSGPLMPDDGAVPTALGSDDGLGGATGGDWEAAQDMGDVSPPRMLSIDEEDMDEDVKALREEIDRNAGAAAAPAKELYTAQVEPQRSELHLVEDGDLEDLEDGTFEERYTTHAAGEGEAGGVGQDPRQGGTLPEDEEEEEEEVGGVDIFESTVSVSAPPSHVAEAAEPERSPTPDQKPADVSPTAEAEVKPPAAPAGQSAQIPPGQTSGTGQAPPADIAPVQEARTGAVPPVVTGMGPALPADAAPDQAREAPRPPPADVTPAQGMGVGGVPPDQARETPRPASADVSPDQAASAASAARPEGMPAGDTTAPAAQPLAGTGAAGETAAAPAPVAAPAAPPAAQAQAEEPPPRAVAGQAPPPVSRDTTAAAATQSAVGTALVRIVSSPFQIARALLGPAVHFRPPSKDAIPRCHQQQQQAPAQQPAAAPEAVPRTVPQAVPAAPSASRPTLDFLRGGLHWPDLSFVFGRTIHQAAADSIRAVTVAVTATEAERLSRPKVRGRSCSAISAIGHVATVPEQSSEEE